ncbi:hypothetical protein [Microbulbifer sp. DLAB2-AA]|uniref:hypothetical protein n=1 Tax=Microbulbifer sp. DLAB2-AA TaxID=3243394 RepID=UPI00403A3D76
MSRLVLYMGQPCRFVLTPMLYPQILGAKLWAILSKSLGARLSLGWWIYTQGGGG